MTTVGFMGLHFYAFSNNKNRKGVTNFTPNPLQKFESSARINCNSDYTDLRPTAAYPALLTSDVWLYTLSDDSSLDKKRNHISQGI